VLVLVVAISASGGAAATQQAQAGVFTGYAFDACTAPSIGALDAWAASPYRAVGIYIGGVNRACKDGNLSASWVSTTLSLGWSLLPLYVGLQAPCVGKASLATISSNVTTASSQGTEAADDAITEAQAFGLPAGSPVYFDMEGYPANNAACTKAVQAFVSGWVGEVRADGFVAGVYGSAASTIRDIAALGASIPDDAWIANWNGVESVFGDKFVSDSVWANHQRVHQYKGGHKETYGGVTINIDSNYVDGAVVGGIIAAPPPQPIGFPAGSVGSGDGKGTASWPAGAFTEPVIVTLTPAAPPALASAAYSLQLTVSRADATAVTRFGAPVTIHVTPPAAGLVPAFSASGATARAVARLSSAALPAGVDVGYTTEPGLDRHPHARAGLVRPWRRHHPAERPRAGDRALLPWCADALVAAGDRQRRDGWLLRHPARRLAAHHRLRPFAPGCPARVPSGGADRLSCPRRRPCGKRRKAVARDRRRADEAAGRRAETGAALGIRALPITARQW